MAKLIIESEEPQEIMRYLKADDMASFIFELVNNGWRDFKHTGYDYQPAWKKINQLLKQYNINIEELTQ